MNSKHLQRFTLAGRRALVTGSTQGIGFALARGLAEAGATVILNGRDTAKVQAAVAKLSGEGHAVEGAAFDVGQPKAVEAAVSALLTGGRAIDILVNTAGIQRRGPLLKLPLEDWQKVIDVDLTSVFVLSRTVAPGMIQRGQGKIVNICSLASTLARPTIGAYAAAKGGLKMLTQAMCAEWASSNLQINGIAPGYILTEMTQILAKDAKFDTWVKSRAPAARWGDVEDLVGACVFLSSPASNFVNGQLLAIDGGVTAVM